MSHRHDTANALRHLATLDRVGLKITLRYMPNSPFRDFYDWALGSKEYYSDWLQLSGMTALGKLSLTMLDGLLTKHELERILPYTVVMNVSNVYEVASDNVALGLAWKQPGDHTFELRREITRAFNNAAMSRLMGQDDATAQFCDEVGSTFRRISAFQQSLSSDKFRELADAYVQANPDASVNQIEYALEGALAAGIETRFDTVYVLRDTLAWELVRESFIRRYAGVNVLLENNDFLPEDLLSIGADTIMVQPVLLYFIVAIAEKVHPLTGYKELIQSGILTEALYDASILTRLLNDVGPFLLEYDQDERCALIEELFSEAATGRYSDFASLLLTVAERRRPHLTRLEKDLKFAEFNVALHLPLQEPTLQRSITSFAEQLEFAVASYYSYMAHMKVALREIAFCTESDIIPQLIKRFVGFHDQLYRAPFDQPEGDFAV